MSQKAILLYILAALAIVSCKNDNSDPKLVGTWTDTNLKYVFNQDLTYGVKYLRTGTPYDTVTADTTWGTYVVDSKRSNVSFEVAGVKTRKGELIEKSLLNATWNYKILGDTVLSYRSSTTLGELKKRQ